jgi:hypothetical protein
MDAEGPQPMSAPFALASSEMWFRIDASMPIGGCVPSRVTGMLSYWDVYPNRSRPLGFQRQLLDQSLFLR